MKTKARPVVESQPYTPNSNSLYESLFKNLNAVILFIDAQTAAIADANLAACAFYGYSHTELTRLKMTDISTLGEAETLARIQKIVKGDMRQMRSQHRLANGELREVEVATNWYETQGQPYIVSLITDVTEKIQAQAQLQESEARYHTYYNNLPTPSYTWRFTGEDFVLVDYNEVALKTTQYLIPKFLGKAVWELFPNDPGIIADIHNCYNQRKTIRREAYMPLRTTGEWRFLDTTYVFVQPDLVVVHPEDITERKQAEQALRVTEERFHSVISAMTEGVVIQDARGAITFCNPSAEKILGLSVEQMMGRTSVDPRWQAVHEDESPFPGETHPAMVTLQTGKACHNVIMGVHSPDGGLRWISINSEPVFLGLSAQPDWVIATFTDVTEQRHATEQIRFQAHLLNEAQQAIISTSLDGSLLYLNHHAEKLLGLHAANSIGKSVEEIFSHQDLKRNRHISELVLAHGSWQGELQLHDHSGKPLLFATVISLIQDEHNQSKCFVGVLEEITERKQAEKALEETNEKFRVLFESSPEAILLIDPQNGLQIVECNAAACQMNGYTHAELIGKPATIFSVYKGTEAEDEAYLEQVRSKGVFRYEAVHLRKDGSAYPVEITTSLFTLGGREFLLGIDRDITERKQVKEAQVDAELRYRALFEQSHDAIFILDLSGRHLDTNQRAADLLGYTRAELLELSVNEFSAEFDKSQQQLERLLRGEHLPVYERLFRKKNGTLISTEINVELVRNADGMPVHIQSIIRDISERKQAEAALLASEEKYRTFIEQSTDGIMFVDEQGNIMEWNRANEALTGLPKAKVFGKPYWDIHMLLAPLNRRDTPEYFERIKATTLSMLQTGQSPFFNNTIESELVTQNGEHKLFEQHIFPVKTETGFAIRSINREITERKQAEAALRISEEKYRAFIEQSSEGISFLDEQGRVIEWNRAMEAITGYAKDAVQGKPYWDIHTQLLPPELRTPEYRERIKALALTLLQTGLSPYFGQVYEGEVVTAAGERRTIEQISFTVQTAQGYRISSLLRDITDRKQAEVALRNSEEQFATIFHASHDAISIARLEDDVYLDVNEAFCNLFAVTREQAVGHTGRELNIAVEPAQREELQRRLRSQGLVTDFEAQFRNHAGYTGSVLISGKLTEIAGTRCVVIFGKDITLRKQAEAELYESEQRFNRVFRASPIGINIFEMQTGVCRDVNDAFSEITGYPHEEIIGHTAAELNLFIDQEENPVWLKTLQTQGEVKDLKTAIRTKTGALRYGVASIKTFELHGEKMGMSLMVDITERVQAELALERSHAELEQRVRARTTELNDLNAELEKALRARDAFIAAVSHELRTPLTGIIGMADILQMPHYGTLTEKQLKAIAIIEKSGKRLLAVVNSVLDFAMLQSGTIVASSNLCSLGEICQREITSLSEQLEKKQQQVQLTLQPENINVVSDDRQLGKIIYHLLENASKFTSEQGELGIEVSGNPDTHQVQLTVWDKGAGIKEVDLPRLFQSFVQLDSSLARQHEGTGLGLVLVKELTELLEGSIRVESVYGRGSRFIVTLPWLEPSQS